MLTLDLCLTRRITRSRHHLYWGVALALMTGLASSSLWGQTPPTFQPPPDLLEVFDSATDALFRRALSAAKSLFAALFVLELAVSAYGWAIEKEGMDQVMREFAVKVIVAAVLFFFVSNPHLVITPLVEGLEGTGAYVAGGAGFAAMEPVEMMDFGRQVGRRFDWALNTAIVFSPEEESGWWDTLVNVATSPFAWLPTLIDYGMLKIVALLSWAVVYMAFIVIAAQMVLAKVEAFIVLSAGAFFLGFSAFRITAGLAESVIRYAASIGVKLFFIQIMAGVAQQMVAQWRVVADRAVYCPFTNLECPSVPVNMPTIYYPSLAMLIGSVVIFAYLAWKIPGTMASRLTGDMQIGVTRALWGK